MTTLKNRDILQLFETIALMDTVLSRLPAKVTYANGRNRAALIDAYEAVNKTRGKLIEQYGIKDEKSPMGYKLEKDGRSLAFKSNEDKKKFEDEFKPILDEEVEINLYTLSIDYFDGVEIDKTTIPTIDLYNKWLVVD